MPRTKTFRKKNPNRNKAGGQKRERDVHQPGERGNYPTIPTENALYEHFYKESNAVPEEEWNDFWSALQRTLPTTFRFTGSKGHALSTLKALQDIYVPQLQNIVWDGQQVEAPRPLQWYPDNLAWGLTIGKSTIRRCPPFKKFQNYLVAETTVGNISRQEAVSMVPPLLMGIEPHHTVLDMCAAPGSKTAQLVEMIHNGEEAAVAAAAAGQGEGVPTKEGERGGRAPGLVIANDADYKRSHMLIHQTKRLNSPNLIVTNQDATMYPSLLISGPEETTKRYLKFDRILADVPCTGDGTARKNYSVWKDWNPQNAFNLHSIQVRILVRGLQMLKVGGRLVYSTCSMNPVENEAVVAAAFDRVGGLKKVAIVNVQDKLPGLKRRPGLKGGWRVMDKGETWYSTFDEVLEAEDGDENPRTARIHKTMFPTETEKSDDDPSRIPLERCVRIYPHLQDTGGFFIAVLEKKEEIRHIKPEEPRDRRNATPPRNTPAKSKAQQDGPSDSVPAPAEAAIPGQDLAPALAKGSASAEPCVGPPSSPSKRRLDSPAPAPAVKKLKAETDGPTLTPDAVAPALSSSGPPIISPTPGPVSTGTPKPFDFRDKGKKPPPPEEPFKFIPHDHAVLERIYKFYGLSERFPRTCFMVRNAEANPVRAIYFTSHLAKTILERNDGRGVRFVHCGVKAFMKQDVQSPDACPWRIQSEGLGIVAPWIGSERIVHATKRETVHALLKELFPKVGNTEADRVKLEAEGRKTIDEIEHQVKELGMGCCVLFVRKTEGQFDEDMILPLWKSRCSCNLMLPKDERKAMLLRLFDDTGDIKDSTSKNHHTHRDAEVVIDEAEIASETDDDVPTEETKGDARGEEPKGEVMTEA